METKYLYVEVVQDTRKLEDAFKTTLLILNGLRELFSINETDLTTAESFEKKYDELREVWTGFVAYKNLMMMNVNFWNIVDDAFVMSDESKKNLDVLYGRMTELDSLLEEYKTKFKAFL